MLKEVLSAQGFLEGTKVVTSWVRPLKVAYIIPGDDADASVKAIESSSLTWGGADHIFIPYAKGISADWMRIIYNYDPDSLVDLVGMSQVEKAHFNALNHFVHDWPPPQQSLFIPGTLIYLAAASFLDAIRTDRLRVIIPTVSPSHPLRLPILARYGSLNESQIHDTLQNHRLEPTLRLADIVLTTTADFVDLKPQILLDPPLKPERSDLPAGVTTIWTLPTLTWLGTHRGPPGRPLLFPGSPEYQAENRKHAEMLLVTGDGDCVSDLCLYWTIRANRGHWIDPFPLWIPLSQLSSTDGREVLSAALARARAQQRPISRVSEILYVLSTSVSREEIEAAVDGPFPKEIVTDGFSDFIPPRFQRGNREVYEVHFQGGHARIPLPREEKLQQFAPFDRVGQEIEVAGALLPQMKSLWRDVPGMPWRISQRGFQQSFYPSYAKPLTSLHVPSTWRVLEGLVEEAGYECKPSDKGRLAIGVLELLGSLPNVGILASSKLFALLSKLAQAEGRQSVKRELSELQLKNEDIEEIRAKILARMTPSQHLRHSLGYGVFCRALGRDNAAPIMKWLLERKILFRGANLRCSVCGLQRWYAMDGIGSEFLCEGCQHISPSPLEQGSTNWLYRLNELYARAFDQGVLVHVLLAYQRAYERPSREDALLGFYPGIEVKAKDENSGREIDYVEVQSGHLVIGECKVNANQFEGAEANKFMAIAKALRCREILLASPASSVSESIMQTMQSLAPSEITLYEGSDLFDRHPWGDPKPPEEYLSNEVHRLLGATGES